MILKKRIGRELKQNFFRYLALFLLITFGMYFIVSFVAAADSVIIRVEDFSEKNNVEDGEFTMFSPLTEENLTTLSEKNVEIEDTFYLNYPLGDDSVLRFFKVREKINLVQVDEGNLPQSKNEICLEKHYAKSNNISLGDTIKVAGLECVVSGLGSSPDYETVLKKNTDPSTDSKTFGTAFVTADLYDQLKNTGTALETEEYLYTYKLNASMTAKELKEYVKGIKSDITGTTNMTSFIVAEDNPRIDEAAEDVGMNKRGGLLGGAILLALFVYVIAVFTIHNIDEESAVIGTLYSMGVSKKQMMQHYLFLPVAITFLGGLVGTAIGYTPFGIGYQISTTVNYYSVPEIEYVFPAYLILYGIFIPTIISIVVNIFAINGKLSQQPLKMIRHEKRQGKIMKIDLKNMGFVNRFRTRQFLREIRSGLTILAGMFMAILLLMEATDIRVALRNMLEQNKEDARYNYMYTLKYPDKEIPDNAEPAYITFLYGNTGKVDLKVSVLGIDEDNKYFLFKPSKTENEITVSSSVAIKFNLSKGDAITLRDKENDIEYTFTVADVVQYSVGAFVFMDIDTMRNFFGKEADYYNVLFADDKIEIDSAKVYSIQTKDDIEKFGQVFVGNMTPMIASVTFVSILIFIVVMYLMMKIMIDRAVYSISLMTIFGYQKNEIRKLYLDGNFITVLISTLICIPIDKMIMDSMFPGYVEHVGVGLDLTFSWMDYFLIFALAIISYFIVLKLLTFRISKAQSYAVALLKERE